jgi:hypothetical protein
VTPAVAIRVTVANPLPTVLADVVHDPGKYALPACHRSVTVWGVPADEEHTSHVSIQYGAKGGWLTDWRPGYAIPSRFTATIEGDWLPYRVELNLAVNEDGVSCEGIQLKAPDGEITARGIRKVPLGECIELATTAALRPVEHGEDSLTIQLMGPPGDVTREATLARREPQLRLSDETLQETARIYLAAERNPTAAVRREHSEGPISYSTAAKWVQRARQLDLIPPANRKGQQR